jgi:hypothetical protein
MDKGLIWSSGHRRSPSRPWRPGVHCRCPAAREKKRHVAAAAAGRRGAPDQPRSLLRPPWGGATSQSLEAPPPRRIALPPQEPALLRGPAAAEPGSEPAAGAGRHFIGTPEQAQLFNDGSEDVTVPATERSRQFGDVYLALACAGGGTVLRAVERAAHRRGLVPPHGALRSASARPRQ